MKARGRFLFFIDKSGSRLYPIRGSKPNINFDDIDVEIEVKEKPVDVKSFRSIIKRHFGYEEGCICDACIARKKGIEAVLEDLYSMVEVLKRKEKYETDDRFMDLRTGGVKLTQGEKYIKYDREAVIFNRAIDKVLELVDNIHCLEVKNEGQLSNDCG